VWLATAAELRHVNVRDSHASERGRESLRTELRMPSRSWVQANVGDRSNVRRAKGFEEDPQRSRAMADGPDLHTISVKDSDPMSEVAIRPVSPDQHDAVMHYFDMVAYADNPNWSKCYCMERLVDDYESRTKDQNRASRSELMRSAKANGLVAYRLGRVVGWCHAAPKSELKSVPGEAASDVGAIVCFVVAPDQRRQGIATQLLERAIEHLRSRGMKMVEAYPNAGDVEPSRWVWAQYVGPLSMYQKAGFEIAETHDDFCIVRKKL
jgi:GNAT superfamily N-acetyltransferase